MMYFIVLLLCVVVSESLVELFVKSVFFSPLRNFLARQENNRILTFISTALSCGYCFSVWTALFLTTLVFMTLSPVLTNMWVLDILIFWLACHRLSNYLHDIADRYFTKEYLK